MTDASWRNSVTRTSSDKLNETNSPAELPLKSLKQMHNVNKRQDVENITVYGSR